MRNLLFSFVAFAFVLLSSCSQVDNDVDTVNETTEVTSVQTSAPILETTVTNVTTSDATFTLYITDPWLVASILLPHSPEIIFETSIVYSTSVDTAQSNTTGTTWNEEDGELGEVIPVIDEDYDTTEPIDVSDDYQDWDYEEYIDIDAEVTVEVEPDDYFN